MYPTEAVKIEFLRSGTVRVFCNPQDFDPPHDVHYMRYRPQEGSVYAAWETMPHTFSDDSEVDVAFDGVGLGQLKALEMMVEKFESTVLPGESGWDAIAAAKTAIERARQ